MTETTTTATTSTERLTRDEAIRRIRQGLRSRTGWAWSVTGGRGTAWGWITVRTRPAQYAAAGHKLSDVERAVLAKALGLPDVHHQGVSIPASGDYYREYVDRAEGRAPSVTGRPYWD